MWCSSCGEKLGDPENDLHDPKGEFNENLGSVENPEDHHIKVVYSEKGTRLQCANTGQMTKLQKAPPGEGGGGGASGSGGGQKKQQAKAKPQKGQRGGVYEFKKEKRPVDILQSVITNEAYELPEKHVREVMSWADIYDGQIPADDLEWILKDLSGVSKQQASLMSKKYEMKLNKWVQETTSSSGGPPIGNPTMPTGSPTGGRKQMPVPPKQSQQQPSQGQSGGSSGTGKVRRKRGSKSSSGSSGSSGGTMPGRRRHRRVERRQEAMDIAAEEMAQEMASNIGRAYGDIQDIMVILLKRKAENDPEWFFEKAEAFGVDILDELAEPSESKREEMERGMRQPQTDNEVDKAMEQVSSGGETPSMDMDIEQMAEDSIEDQEEEEFEETFHPTENNITPEEPPQEEHEMEQHTDGQETEPGESDAFDEIMGGLGE